MYRLMLADLRYSVRALLAKPSFALIAVFTLALGIGANAAVYSMFHQLVTRPLAVPDAQQLVNLSAPGPKLGSTSNTGIGPREAIFSYPMYRDLQAQQQVFTGIAAHLAWRSTWRTRVKLRLDRRCWYRPSISPCCNCSRRWVV